MIRLLRLAIAVMVAYIAFAMIMALIQRSLTFHPERAPLSELQELAAVNGMTPWRLPSGEFVGWKRGDDSSPRKIVLFHGNAGHALHRAHLAESIGRADPGAQILILEYPGYGAREGKPSEKSLVDSATAALESMGDLKPVVVGISLGTGVASQMAAHSQGLVLITPFDSLISAARHHYPWLPVDIMMADRFDSASALESRSLPVFIVAGSEDQVTPVSLAHSLHDSYQGPKKLKIIDGAGHNDVTSALGTQEWKDILDWVRGR